MICKGMVCTDLDGTIAFHREEDNSVYIKEADLAALHQLRQSGYAIVVATGREMNGIRSFLRQSIVAFDYYIGGNGGVITNQNFKILRNTPLPKDTMVKMIAYIQNEYPDIRMMGTDGWRVYYIDSPYTNVQVDPEDTRNVEIISLAEYIEGDYNFIMMNANAGKEHRKDPEAIMPLEADVRRLFGHEINIFRNQAFLDFAPFGVSKGNAVEYLADHLNLSKAQVHVIGDSWNDVSMFEIDANSYSFKHAEEELQKRAGNVVESFAEMVDKFIELDDE